MAATVGSLTIDTVHAPKQIGRGLLTQGGSDRTHTVNVTTDNALHLLLDKFMATARIRVFKDLEKVVLARAF